MKTTIQLPKGFRVAATHCGIKQSDQEDVSLIVSDRDCVAVGMYTENQVVAAPVTLDRKRTPASNIRAIIANSGNANACTGKQGELDAAQMARLTAAAIQSEMDQVLVLSTGIIGEPLPMDRVAHGIGQAASMLGDTPEDLVRAARGLMTTDTRPKLAGRTLTIDNETVTLVGVAKGAAMIGPRMATMLAVIITDAKLSEEWAHQALREAVEVSFHCISVEGHTSTNDTILLLANAATCVETSKPTKDELRKLGIAVQEICTELARAIPQDGEGASHLIEIEVTECQTRDDAHRIAKAVADSPLVKTAIAGADPNWGRIVSAAGYSGVTFDPQAVHLQINGHKLFEAGQPVEFDEGTVSESIRSCRDTRIQLSMGQGGHAVRFWTCDLTAEYVRLNADYHT